MKIHNKYYFMSTEIVLSEPKKIFNIISQKYPIRYVSKRRYNTETIHDIIHTNIQTLIPNIKEQFNDGIRSQKLTNWLTLSQKYIVALNDEYIKQCKQQRHYLSQIIQLELRNKEFDICKTQKLPGDIIQYIYQYLPYDVKRDLLIAKYPDIWTDLKKKNGKFLKRLKGVVDDKYYRPAFRRYYMDNVYFGRSHKNKDDTIKDIIRVFTGLCNMKLKRVPDIQYISKLSFDMIYSIIYLVYCCKEP